MFWVYYELKNILWTEQANCLYSTQLSLYNLIIQFILEGKVKDTGHVQPQVNLVVILT